MTEKLPDVVKAAPSRALPMLLAIGPGIVVSGSVMGSGELINAPLQAAQFGFVLLWAVILSCLIKYFLQVEIARHCLVHNRTPVEALNLCPGPKVRGTSWVGLLYMVGYTISMASVVGILGAIAGLLHGLAPLSRYSAEASTDLWTLIIFGLTFLLLWRGFYGELEKLVTFLVMGFSFSVVVGLVLVQNTESRITIDEVVSGLKFSLGDHEPRLAAFAVISLLGALGTTANEMFMYPYWVLEKGYGRHVGPREAPEWTDRVRGWVRMIQVDAGTCTLLATVITAAYFLMGAAILHRQRIAPEGMEVVHQISAMFTGSFGRWSYGLFMIGAFFTLFSTLVVATAATGRMWADVLTSLKLLDGDNPKARLRCYRTFQTLYLVLCLVMVLVVRQPPAKLVIFGQYVSGLFNTPLLMFGICWIAFHTDRRLRMRRTTAVLLLASVAVIVTCLVLGVLNQSGVIGH